MEEQEKLAQDPNNQMTPEQLQEQEKIRAARQPKKDKQVPQGIQKQYGIVPKHYGEVPKVNNEVEEDNGQAHRDTPHQDSK